MENFLDLNKTNNNKKKLLSFLDDQKNIFDTSILENSKKLTKGDVKVNKITIDKTYNANLSHLKQYDFKLSNDKEMNLNQFSYEIKINKLNNLKVKLFQKLKTKKKEIKKEVQFKNKFSKNITTKKAVARLANKHKLDDYLHKYKSIYKKITNKLKYKLESRFKKFRIFNLVKKKTKKQEKKKNKKKTCFLNYFNNKPDVNSFIEITDFKNYFSTVIQDHFKVK